MLAWFLCKSTNEKNPKVCRERTNNSVLQNQEVFIIAHCSTGYLQGILEVLRDPEYPKPLQKKKFLKEIQIMEEFFELLNKDDK